MEVRRRAVWITFRQSCASRRSQGELCIIESAAFSSDFHHRCAVCCKASRLFQVRKVGSKLAALLLEVFFRSEGKGWEYFCSCSPANRTKASFTSPKSRRHFPSQSAASARERNSHPLQGRPRQKPSHWLRLGFLNGLTDRDLLAPGPGQHQQHAGRRSSYTILDCCTSSYGDVPAVSFLVI